MIEREKRPDIPVFQHDVGECGCGTHSWLYSFVDAKGAPIGRPSCGGCMLGRVRHAEAVACDGRRAA